MNLDYRACSRGWVRSFRSFRDTGIILSNKKMFQLSELDYKESNESVCFLFLVQLFRLSLLALVLPNTNSPIESTHKEKYV